MEALNTLSYEHIVDKQCNSYICLLQPFSVACGITLKGFLGASHFQSQDTQTQLVTSAIPFGAKLKRVVFRVFGITKR